MVSPRRFLPLLAMLLGLAAAPLAAGRGAPAHDSEPAIVTPFIMMLTGGQMPIQPPIGTSPKFGVGFLTFNEKTKVLCYSISHSPLVGETSAHFHGPAAPGEESEEHLWPTDDATSLPVGSPKDGCTDPLSADAERALKAGLWFLEIHTVAYPFGELRGQVLPVAGVKYGPGLGESIGGGG